jgi:hypothetical protein
MKVGKSEGPKNDGAKLEGNLMRGSGKSDPKRRGATTTVTTPVRRERRSERWNRERTARVDCSET